MPVAERKKLGVMWNWVEKREDAEHKFSISMSDTVANSSSSPSIHSQPAFSFNQQWKAADLKKRSFIKIRTPGKHAQKWKWLSLLLLAVVILQCTMCKKSDIYMHGLGCIGHNKNWFSEQEKYPQDLLKPDKTKIHKTHIMT